MNQSTMPQFFPIWAFPPIARAAIQEVIAATQAPTALVAGSALSAMSLAVQNTVNVRRLDGLTSCCSLFLITVSDSGERKSTVDNLFTSPFVEHQAMHDAKYREDLEKYRIEKRIWSIKQRSISKAIERAFSAGEPTDQFEESLANHEQSVPNHPRKEKLIYNDVTPAAFAHGLYVNSKSAGIFDDEAGRIFSSSLVEDLGLLNKAWGSADIHVDRRSSECFTLKDARVTISWMVQEPVFTRYLERKGDQARGIGFLARCLVSRPESTQGSRFISALPATFESLPKFYRRVTDLLSKGSALEDKDVPPKDTELHFSPEAQAEWVAVFNQIEQHINPGGVFCENRDYASKVAENIARVAAIFHCFEGYDGVSISLEMLRSATTVVLWYAHEFVRLFSPPDPLHETIKDAFLLQDWLIKLFRSRNWQLIPKNFILQRGPNSLRSKDRLDWALNCLCSGGRISGSMQGRKEFVHLNTAFFGPAALGQEPWGFTPLG